MGVGVGTLVIGGGLALLVSFYDFPGRRWLDWALVLPMAMPGYVLVFVVLGQYDLASPLQSSLFGGGLRISGIRSPLGAICILTAVLYPYVYVLGRSAFLGQSRQTLEAARSLGNTYGQSVRRVALPLARPALAAGAALAVMEALADFGTVDLLGVQALTSVIYRVWNGAFDQAAALQLATVLLTLTLVMVTIERLLRGRANYNQALGRGDAVVPVRLRGWRAWLAALPGWVLLTVVFFVPVAQLVSWSVETIADGTTVPNLAAGDAEHRGDRRDHRRRRDRGRHAPGVRPAGAADARRACAHASHHGRLRGAGNRRRGRRVRPAPVARPSLRRLRP